MALNTYECQKKGSKTDGPPGLEKNVPPMKHKTHIFLVRSPGSMPWDVYKPYDGTG